jgi:hypothetical protein
VCKRGSNFPPVLAYGSKTGVRLPYEIGAGRGAQTSSAGMPMSQSVYGSLGGLSPPSVGSRYPPVVAAKTPRGVVLDDIKVN